MLRGDQYQFYVSAFNRKIGPRGARGPAKQGERLTAAKRETFKFAVFIFCTELAGRRGRRPSKNLSWALLRAKKVKKATRFVFWTGSQRGCMH